MNCGVIDMEVRIIVTGSRDVRYYAAIAKALDSYISSLPQNTKIIFVIGTCPGADMYGERYAYEHDFEVHEFPMERNKYGTKAVKERNVRMANYATADGATGVLFAFWNGKSEGTRDMIKQAKVQGLKVNKFMVN